MYVYFLFAEAGASMSHGHNFSMFDTFHRSYRLSSYDCFGKLFVLQITSKTEKKYLELY